MDAFIVRPFGIKNEIDFDGVHEKLIVPALEKAGIKGYTTGIIVEAGNIRQDMFQLLLTSDLVIADISVHNANVFYELGIRHALRSGKTLLIRCQKDEVPFDLKTDRYFSYDHEDPEKDVEALCESIEQTMNSGRTDSPIFFMLPKLKPQNPEDFLAIPADFSKEVYEAQSAQDQGKLALLAAEAQFFPWELPALRAIGESPYRSRFYRNAKEIWEKVRERKPADIEANEYLATIYQRLAEMETKRNPVIALQLLAKSEQAINCLFEQFEGLDRNKRAEAYSLRARNEKAKWVSRWIDLETEKMGKEAIRSNLLRDSYENYSLGFYEDLNHFYSGINALGLLKIMISLAERESMVWESKFETSFAANNALSQYKKEFDDLAIIVHRAVASKKKALEIDKKTDAWVNITFADIALLTSYNSERVSDLYRKALESGMGLNFDAPMRQLLLYEKLQVMPANVAAALKEFSGIPDLEEKGDKKILLFTGHMIDKEGREKSRFPKEKEMEVRKKIKDSVQKILQESEIEKEDTKPSTGNFVGIAGGACGGDILFHEVCRELGIKSRMYIALPPDKFIVSSVQFAGSGWVERFNTIYDDKNTPVQILAEVKKLPVWLRSKKDYSIWERNNLWILNAALSRGTRNLIFLALWDGKEGDGPGGTKHMIEEVKKRGAKSSIIDI